MLGHGGLRCAVARCSDVSSYRRRCSSSSPRGTLISFLANDLNRPIGVFAGAAPPSALSADSVWGRLRDILAYQFFVHKPLSGYGRYYLPKSAAVFVIAFVEPEGLFVEIPIKMDRINADIGPLEGALQEAPKVFDVVGVDMITHEFDRMVNGFMGVVSRQAEIGFEGIRVDFGAEFDSSANFRCQRAAFHVRDVRRLDAAGSIFGAALDDAENRFLAGTASSLDLPLADMPMHVLGEAANESFIGFDLAAHFEKRSSLHREPDAVIHEPGSLLSDAKGAVHLVAADPVFAIGDHPNRGEPFTEIDWAVLEDRSHLGRKLTLGMLFFAFPNAPSRDEAWIGATACRAANATWPTKLDHRTKRDIGVREVADSLDQGAGLVWCVRHADQYDSDRSLRQVYYYPF
jgi:hypothetical protein